MSAPRDGEQTTAEDELWDPDAQRRVLLAMSMAERLEIVAALFAQSQLFPQRDPGRGWARPSPPASASTRDGTLPRCGAGRTRR